MQFLPLFLFQLSTKHIEGFIYAKKESRSEIFADDTPIFVKRNPEYLRKCADILKISGLQGNLEKTSVIPIRGNYDIEDKLCIELTLIWANKFTLLGFQMDRRLKKLNKNYDKCFEKMHEISQKWARYSRKFFSDPPIYLLIFSSRC